MRLALHKDCRRILRRAWSVRLMLVAAVLSGTEVVLPFLQGFLTMPPGIFAAFSAMATAGAFLARITAQKNMRVNE
jgi:membrane protein DedA with SNARE-associated domain